MGFSLIWKFVLLLFSLILYTISQCVCNLEKQRVGQLWLEKLPPQRFAEACFHNSINFWYWCLLSLKNEWPVLTFPSFNFIFFYLKESNMIWNICSRKLLSYCTGLSILSFGFLPTLIISIFLLFSMDWKEFWEKRGAFCCWSKQLIPSKLIWWQT